MNSACLSTNLSISQGQATLSTRGCSRVIHFMVVLPKHLLLPSVASQSDSGPSHLCRRRTARRDRRRGCAVLALSLVTLARTVWDCRDRYVRRMDPLAPVLQMSNGDNLDVDNPFLLGLSAQDVGSGVRLPAHGIADGSGQR